MNYCEVSEMDIIEALVLRNNLECLRYQEIIEQAKIVLLPNMKERQRKEMIQAWEDMCLLQDESSASKEFQEWTENLTNQFLADIPAQREKEKEARAKYLEKINGSIG